MQAIVHAADIQDRDGGVLLMAALFGAYPFLLKLYADSGYTGPRFQQGLGRVSPDDVPIDIVARCHAERCTPSGRPLRPDRPSALRHVGVGTHDRPRSYPTNTGPGFYGPPVEFGRALRRAARGRPPTRRHVYDDH